MLARVAIPAPAIDPKVAAAITGKIGDLLLMSWLIEVELGISGRRLSKESCSSENSFSLALKWASMSLSRLLSSSMKSESWMSPLRALFWISAKVERRSR